jgi:uncharacterized protein YjbI with pentapeptide repeats
MQNITLEGSDLSIADPSGATLNLAMAPQVNLAGTKLRDASLLSVVRTGANLANFDLRGARLGGYLN